MWVGSRCFGQNFRSEVREIPATSDLREGYRLDLPGDPHAPAASVAVGAGGVVAARLTLDRETQVRFLLPELYTLQQRQDEPQHVQLEGQRKG